MRRAALTAMAGALACSLAACAALVGLGPAPSEAQDPDASGAGGPSPVEGGLVMDASDVTTTDASDAASDRAIALDGGLDGAPSLLVASGAALRLEGITSDGWVLYQDPSDGAIHALSLGGGHPVLVAPGLSAVIQGKVALVYTSSAPEWTLTAWTSTTGPNTEPAVDSFAVMNTKVSADSTRLVYPALAPAGSTQYHLLEANTDFSSPLDLGLVTSSTFEVSVTSDRFVVSRGDSCDAFSNAGTAQHLFDGGCAGNAGNTVLSSDYGTNGIKAILVESEHGGAVQSFSPPGDAGTITGYANTPNGAGLVFADQAGNLWSSTLANSTTQLLPNTLGGSPSGSLTMAQDGTHFYFGNGSYTLLVASVTGGNAVAPQPLEGGAIEYIAFGSDSRFFFFKEGSELEVLSVDSNTTAHVASDVNCEPVQGSCFLAARDSRLVYISGSDLWAVDARDLAHPTMLARSAVQFIVDQTGSTVVYRFKDSSMNSQSGLYAVAVP